MGLVPKAAQSENPALAVQAVGVANVGRTEQRYLAADVVRPARWPAMNEVSHAFSARMRRR